jgi:hypothetical protein
MRPINDNLHGDLHGGGGTYRCADLPCASHRRALPHASTIGHGICQLAGQCLRQWRLQRRHHEQQPWRTTDLQFGRLHYHGDLHLRQWMFPIFYQLQFYVHCAALSAVYRSGKYRLHSGLPGPNRAAYAANSG